MKKKTSEELNNELKGLPKKIVDYKKKEIESSVVEQNLKESEKKYRTLTENLRVGVFRSTVGLKGKFIEVNSAFVKMFGYRSKEEIYKFNVSDLYNNPEDRRKFNRTLLEKGFLKNEVLNLKKKDGTSFVALVNTNAVKDEKGEVIYFDGVIKDITERMQAEETLKKSEQNLRALFMAMTDIVLELDREGRYINIAPTSPDLLYKPASEILGKTLHEIFPLKEADKFMSVIHKSLDEDRIVKIEYPLKIKNKIIWFEGRATPKTSDTVLFIAHDITERKNADEKIRESEEKLRSFMNTTTIGVWCFKPEFPIDITQPSEKQIDEFMKSVCIECNETYAIMMGTTKDKIIGIMLSEVLPDCEETREYFIEFIKGGYKLDGGETHEISKTGEEKYFSNSFFATIIDNMLLQAWGTQTDITERKQAEETQKVLYNIAHAINTTKTLNELYKTVHIQLGKIIDTKNFYIALYDKENDTILFPYHIDEKSKFISYPARKTLTAYVIRTGKPLLGTEQVIGQLIEAGEVGKGKKGTSCKIWLGVPLTVDNVVIGAIAVQSYTDASIYSEKDLEILEFVSDEIALAIRNKQAEESLLESEEKFRYLVKNSNDVFVKIDENGKETYVSDSVERITGFSPAEIIWHSGFEFIHPDDIDHMSKSLSKLLKIPGGTIRDEYRHQRKGGGWVHLEAIGENYLHEPSVRGIVLNVRDITERKQAERVQLVIYKIAKAVNTTKNIDELYNTIHQLLNTVIDVKNFYIALYDEDENTISFPYYIDEKDTKPEPVPKELSKGLTEYVIRTGKSLLAPKEYYLKLAKEGKIEISGSISEVWIGIPLRIENKIVGIVSVQSYKDASFYNKKDLEILELISYEIAIAIEHKKTEQINLRLSESIRNARDGIILTNPESRITYINPAFEKMSGYTQGELLNKDPADLIVTEDTTAIANEIRSAVKTKGEWQGELYCKRKNEDIYPIDTRVFAIKNEKGEIVEIAAIQQDITERKQAEEKIRESEKSFKDIFNNAIDAIYIQNIDGKFLDVNQGAVIMYGYTKEEMIGKTPDIIGAPGKNDLEMVGECIKKAYNGEPQQFEFWGQRKNGEVFPKIVRLSSGYYFGKKAIFAFAIDITDRKQTEEILNKELRKRKILQDVALTLLETDLNKSIKTALKAIRIGLDLPKAMLRIRVDPNNDWQIVDCRENLLGIESCLPTNKRGEEAILAYEKKEISVVNDIRKKYWYEKHKDIWEKTKTLAYLSIPCIDHSGDVKGILYLHDDKVRIWSDDDKNIGEAVAAELASIINRKHADEELKINRERLKTANSILRHDITNDIVVIKSALDIYRDEDDETMLDEIEKRVKKSLNTINKQRDQERFIDSHSDLDEYQMEKVAYDSIKNFPDIKINVAGTGTAYADNAIYSVFENIIDNAVKHGKTTKMDIDIHSDEMYCEIRFVDYGIGIPDEYKHRIFDEGFSYGKTGHTGIGLYIVWQTIEDYDGEVFVEDNKPQGAVFIVHLRKTIER